MQSHLPDKIDPWKLAAVGSRLEGDIPLRRMLRLTSLVSTTEGWVKVIVEAGVDEQGVYFISGQLNTSVVLICQRCMQPMQWPMEVNFRLGLVRFESQVPSLPGEYDPLLTFGDGLRMSEWVEDELILALPLVARHIDVRECEALGFTSPSKDRPSTGSEEGTNPFAALSTLLKDAKK